MKLAISNLFDADSVIKKFAAAKLAGVDDFINGVSDMSDKLIQVLKNNVSLADNIDCSIKEVTLKDNVLLSIQSPERIKQVKHIVVTRSLPFSNPVRSFAWAYNAKGEIDIQAEFKGEPTTSVTVTLVMYF